MSAEASLSADQLKQLIREVPDFPKKGILFYDITTLLKDKDGFATLVDRLSEHYIHQKIDLVLGMEARGFIFAPALAYRLHAGFVPVRKVGKLPAETVKFDYALEYGINSLEMHKDAIQKGQRVLIVDDLLATGGTAEATAKPVSYTHLDVYKRQHDNSAPIQRRRGASLSGHDGLGDPFQERERLDAGGAVSYTHLDVYKRQG